MQQRGQAFHCHRLNTCLRYPLQNHLQGYNGPFYYTCYERREIKVGSWNSLRESWSNGKVVSNACIRLGCLHPSWPCEHGMICASRCPIDNHSENQHIQNIIMKDNTISKIPKFSVSSKYIQCQGLSARPIIHKKFMLVHRNLIMLQVIKRLFMSYMAYVYVLSSIKALKCTLTHAQQYTQYNRTSGVLKRGVYTEKTFGR